MAAFFRDARLKIERANKHIAELQDAILALENTKTATVQLNAQTGFQNLIHEIPNLENTCLNLSLILGDAIHNLRTALDFAWVSTIERHVPTISSSFTKFPARKTRQQVEAILHGVKIDSLCPALFDCVLSQIQPYEAGQAGVIYPLHNLDISDKHLLILGLSAHSGIRGIVLEKDGEIIHGTGTAVRGFGPYIIPFDADVKIKEKGELSFAITIEEAGIFEGLPILDLLSGFSQYVAHVVHLLENL